VCTGRELGAGRDLSGVVYALGSWADRWTDITHEHADPVTCCGRGASSTYAKSYCRLGESLSDSIFREGSHASITGRIDPGFDVDVDVVVSDPLVFSRWHAGYVTWSKALRSGGVTVSGTRELCRTLPTWNAGPEIISERRAKAQKSATR
jgi:hypothetical protein